MRARLLLTALVAALGTTGCQMISFGEDAGVKPVWDLRESHTLDDVGWPEGHDSSVFEVDPPPGELTILLPEGISIAGPFDVTASRPIGFDEQADPALLDYLVINYDREPVARAAERAAALSREWGLDGSKLVGWAAGNADEVDRSAGGSMESTGSQPLSDDGPSVSIKARAVSGGLAYLSVTVFWGNEPPATAPLGGL